MSSRCRLIRAGEWGGVEAGVGGHRVFALIPYIGIMASATTTRKPSRRSVVLALFLGFALPGFSLSGLALPGVPPAAAQEGDLARAAMAYRMGDYAQALSIARPLADGGAAEAQFLMGDLYSKGLGLTQNHYEAARWYRLAADKGEARSQTALGIQYEYGRGVSRNYAEAAKWYRKGADQGQVEAQFLLGQMYERGYGVSQDDVLAYLWFSLAAETKAPTPRPEDAQAKRSAAQRRVSIGFRMTQDEIDEARQLAQAWQPVHSQ